MHAAQFKADISRPRMLVWQIGVFVTCFQGRTPLRAEFAIDDGCGRAGGSMSALAAKQPVHASVQQPYQRSITPSETRPRKRPTGRETP